MDLPPRLGPCPLNPLAASGAKPVNGPIASDAEQPRCGQLDQLDQGRLVPRDEALAQRLFADEAQSPVTGRAGGRRT